jgi:hypothetical protein
MHRTAVFWGHAPRPPGSASPRHGSSAMQTNASSLGGGGEHYWLIGSEDCFLAASPRPPGSASPRQGKEGLVQRRPTLLTSLSGDEEHSPSARPKGPVSTLSFGQNLSSVNRTKCFVHFLEKERTPLYRLSRSHPLRSSAKQNNAFCFFFWIKKNSRHSDSREKQV